MEFFHSKAEMDKFYHDIENESAMKLKNTKLHSIQSKLEIPAKPHNAVVEDLIHTATVYNAKDEWGLPSRPSVVAAGFMDRTYANEKIIEDKSLNQLKMNMWTGDLHEK